MRIAKRFTLGATMSLLVASPILASDVSSDREAARIQKGAHAEERAPAKEHVRASEQEGSVVEVSETRIVLMTPQGDEKSFELSPSTEIRRGTAEVPISDVDTGERAYVSAQRSEVGDPVATWIFLARRADSRSSGTGSAR